MALRDAFPSGGYGLKAALPARRFQSLPMDLELVLKRAVELGASDIHLKVERPPILRCDGNLAELDGRDRSERARPRARARAGLRRDAQAAADVPRDGRARQRVLAARPAAVPRQRIPPARLDLDRLPCHPARSAELRSSLAAARRPPPRRGAPRSRPRHGRHRLGKDDDARGDHRSHEPLAPPAHRHDRGPDRDRPPRPRLHRQPARGRARHRLVLAGAAPRSSPGPRRDPDRRAPRRRDGRDGSGRRRVGPPCPLDDAHGRRLRDDRPDGRVLPGRQAAADPLDPRRRAPRRHQPAPAPADRPADVSRLSRS